MKQAASRFSLLIAILFLSISGFGQFQFDINGPAGSGTFGDEVVALPNGNFVVIDPGYSIPGGATNVGAVYLYGPTGNLISTLTGSTTDDQIGGAITILTNGNFVVRSTFWNNGTVNRAGAVTWIDGTNGLNGVVSAANSLVGSANNDRVGNGGVTALTNGNYVVGSFFWDNGTISNAGAATWGDGTTGVSGVISETNSLVGSSNDDRVNDVTALTNGNYVVTAPSWDDATVDNVGAATWGNGLTGITGTISASNSLVGSTDGDVVGNSETIALTNGNYVVGSENWNNSGAANAGAATWGNGTTGTTGIVSASNSLVGSTAGDRVGDVLIALTNGNYVVQSDDWNNGVATGAGAATWADGTTGITGTVSETNSLVGSTTDDGVGGNVTALTNGNYVVGSPNWHDGTAVDVGAATWGNGTTGITGTVSETNSLVGSTADDRVGNAVLALTNGHYVVRSPDWDNGTVIDAGAATWGNGTSGVTGTVSATNSLVGSVADDSVGNGGTALTNGNYVLHHDTWDNGGVMDGGYTMWVDGSVATNGVFSASNALVGTSTDDEIADDGVIALANGNYVVGSSLWNNGATLMVGAVTLGNGTNGTTGPVSASNSTIGSTADDEVGDDDIEELPNGDFVVFSRDWDNGTIVDAGAVSLLSGTTPEPGPLTSDNSVFGTIADGGTNMSFDFDSTNDQLIVGRPAENIVTIFRRITPARADFDGDGRTDQSVFRSSEGNWYLNQSFSGFTALNWGIASDTLVPADYDGDNKTDIAVFRPSETEGISDFIILNSNGFTLSGLEWGIPGDVPVVGDHDGDGLDDVAVWRESDLTWYVRNSQTKTVDIFSFGQAGDIPVVGDWDGDGRVRPGTFRPGDNTWYLARATGDPETNFDAFPLGETGDMLVPGDYDGDARTDIAVWRPSSGTWFIRDSATQTITNVDFGTTGDIPVPGDYDGDGKEDTAVYRDGDWWINNSTSGVTITSFGINTDMPIPSLHNP